MAAVTPVRAAGRSAEGFYRLGEFTAYPAAAHLLHRLYEGGFPILRARVLDLHAGRSERSERIAGRATLIGAGLGAWLGLLAGLVLLVVVPGPAWLNVVLGALSIGAAAGGVLGLIIHRGTDGRSPDPADRFRYGGGRNRLPRRRRSGAGGPRRADPARLPDGRLSPAG